MSVATAGRGAPELDVLVDAALAEDVGDGDRTTRWTVPEGATGRARVVAKARGIVAGTRAAGLVFERVDPGLALFWKVEEGGAVAAGAEVLELRGSLAAILAGERTALNFLGRLSGVATLASRFAEAVRGTGCEVADTRKTTPGWRSLEKRAAAAGGAVNHRMGLYDMVLIKENHIRAAGGLREALRSALGSARAAGLTVEVEVRTLPELEVALEERPDRILLDNMTTAALRDAVRRARRVEPPRPLLEASGGITLETARETAETGVDRISVGAITHSAPALDLSLSVDP